MIRELVLSDQAIDNRELKRFLDSSFGFEIDHICLPTSLLGLYPEYKGHVKYSALIDYPFGLADTKTKMIQVKYASSNGACMIDVVLNHCSLINYTKYYLEELVTIGNYAKSLSLEMRVICEYRLLSTEHLTILGKNLTQNKIRNLIISTGTMPDTLDESILTSKFFSDKFKIQTWCTNVVRDKRSYEKIKGKTHGIRFTSVKAAENIFGKLL